MDQEKIGKFIAECRKEKNLTQSQLAEKLNMSNKTISKWETGKGMPDPSIMLELCENLGINVNELLSGEHLKDEQYKEKADENIISIAKESDKNKKIKNIIIIVLLILCIVLIIVKIGKGIYECIQVNIDYDERLIKCEITDDSIICSFNGLSLVTLYSEKINTDTETLVFITGKMLLQNKIHSHYETWQSMSKLINNEEPDFNSQLIINKQNDIVDCKEKIKVYYTNISFDTIKNANKSKLYEIIQQSHLMAEN